MLLVRVTQAGVRDVERHVSKRDGGRDVGTHGLKSHCFLQERNHDVTVQRKTA